jgi:hypothetical protein
VSVAYTGRADHSRIHWQWLRGCGTNETLLTGATGPLSARPVDVKGHRQGERSNKQRCGDEQKEETMKLTEVQAAVAVPGWVAQLPTEWHRGATLCGDLPPASRSCACACCDGCSWLDRDPEGPAPTGEHLCWVTLLGLIMLISNVKVRLPLQKS